MAAKDKHKPPPRPGKNSDGQDKTPPAPPRPPVAAGSVNPMTHPAAPGMQPPGPVAGPAGMQEQSRQVINMKDAPPPMQQQMLAAQGLDPMAPLKMLQNNVTGAVAGGPSQGPVPNALQGPGVPPDVASFPDDMAHLHQLMQQGLGPGSSPQEGELGRNAHAIARAHAQQAEMNAQNDQQTQAVTAHLGGLLHHLGSTGQLPAPEDVAAHVASLQGGQQPQAAGQPPGQLDQTLAPQPGGPPGPQAPGGPPTTPDGQIPPDIIAQLMKAKRRPQR